MTTKQLQAELTQTDAKIRSTNETLQALRVQRTHLKARLSEARAAEKAKAWAK